MTKKFWVFEKLFSENSGYFGNHYIIFDTKEIRDFFEEDIERHKTIVYLYFYLESLVCVKDNADKINQLFDHEKVGSASSIHSNHLWYSSLIQILIGLIQQNGNDVQGEKCKHCNKQKHGKIQRVFNDAMDKLEDGTKKYLVNYYKSGDFREKDFKSVCEDIYADRNFFAHEIDKLNPPEKTGLTFEMKSEHIEVKFNIKPEAIVLYIIISLMRTMGYEGSLEVGNNKKMENLSDFI